MQLKDIMLSDHRMVKLFRFFPATLKGKLRLATVLLKEEFTQENVFLRDRFGHVLEIPDMREQIARELLIHGIYESATCEFIAKYLSRGGTFIDIGANIGVFTCLASKIVGKDGLILAIEASPSIFQILKRNVQRNHIDNVLLEHCAVQDSDIDKIEFHEAPKTKFGMGTLGNYFKENTRYVLGRTLNTLVKKHNLKSVQMIKSDIEGWEASVFLEADQVLSQRQAPMIVFEFMDWAESATLRHKVGTSQEILRSYGYKIWLLQDYLRDKKPLSDVLRKGFAMLVAAKKRCQ